MQFNFDTQNLLSALYLLESPLKYVPVFIGLLINTSPVVAFRFAPKLILETSFTHSLYWAVVSNSLFSLRTGEDKIGV